jgi:hypothetical protein
MHAQLPGHLEAHVLGSAKEERPGQHGFWVSSLRVILRLRDSPNAVLVLNETRPPQASELSDNLLFRRPGPSSKFRHCHSWHVL